MSATPPSDKARYGRIALAILAGALGTALVGGGLYIAFRPAPKPPVQTEIESAEQTEPATMPASIATTTTEATSSPDATTSPGPSGPGGSADKPAPTGAKVAYRLNGQIYVSAEDGSGAVPLGVQYDTYALSPDGRSLAGARALPGGAPAANIVVHDLVMGGVRLAGSSVLPLGIAWSPQSDWLAYTADAGESAAVMRVERTGAGNRELVSPGVLPAISRTGTKIAYRQSEEGASPLNVFDVRESAARSVGGASGAVASAWGPGDVLYFTRSAGSAKNWEVRRSRAPYSASEKVGSMTLPSSAFSLADLSVSPDGKRAIVAAIGDDHYSRLSVLDIPSGRFRVIDTRRDAYPIGWTASGSRLMYFEGNTYQGEPSAMMSCRPDGSRRDVIVQGATR